jgi:microcystin-dependent protein
MASSSATPVGTVLMYAGRTDGAGLQYLMSAGWILCDGHVYPNGQFLDLFDVIGGSYGSNQNGFAVPSYQGVFMRGVDGTDPLSRDPEAAARVSPRPDLSSPGNSGNTVGSFQSDELGSHQHPYTVYTDYIESTHTGGHQCLSGSTSSATGANGGSETRPVNQYVDFIIKAVADPDVVPLGAVVPYAGSVTPPASSLKAAGWLPCTGGKLAAGEYKALYQTMSTMFGADDNASFRLPDFRGRFLRGVVGQLLPNQKLLDPDYLTRTAPQPSLAFQGNTGNLVGSVQPHQYFSHTHSYNYNNDYWEQAATAIGHHAENNSAQSATTATNSSSKETRPININVNYLLKAASA